MNIKNVSHKTVFAIIATALAASLCCITPVLAVLAGIGGIASTFSWLDPFRPFLIGLVIAILGFAWYQKLKPRSRAEIACECETDGKPSYWQSRQFLGLVTLLAGILISFPYYSGMLFAENKTNTISVEKENIAHAEITIKGMTCTGCENSVNKALSDLNGVIHVKSDYHTGIAKVRYDKTKVSSKQFKKAIEESVGYKVLNIKVKE
jgi:copper chaperone CopZ